MVKFYTMRMNVFKRYENNYPDGCVCDMCGEKIKPGMSYFNFGKQTQNEERSGPRIKCLSCGSKRAA